MAGAGYICVVIPYLPAQSRGGGATACPQHPMVVFREHGNHEMFSRTAYGTIIWCQIRRQQRTISRSTRKRAENIKNITTVEKSITFHLVLPPLSSTTDPGRRADLPSASLVSWPRLVPLFHLFHLDDCTLPPQVA